MNLRTISLNIGRMLLLLAVSMVACVLLGLLLPAGRGHSSDAALFGWEEAIAITAAAAGVLLFVGRKARGAQLLRREALGTVAMGWIACVIFGSLPFVFCEPRLSLWQAFFESVSGFTTTGATVIEDLTVFPKTILLWRSSCQWIGGIGILAMFVLVLADFGGGRSLYQNESSAHNKDMAGVNMKETIRYVWILYLSLTITCASGMYFLGMTPFQAVNHALTTTSTGGFGTENDSYGSFNSALKIWTTIFMIVSSLSFPLLIGAMRKRRLKVIRQHEESRAYLLIVLLASVILLAGRLGGGPFVGSETWLQEGVDTVFNAVSISTTAGFAAGDYDQWHVGMKALLLFLMLIGGCSASTAGGLKTSRLILWIKLMRIEVGRVIRPSEVRRLTINGHKVPEGSGARGQLFLVLGAAIVTMLLGTLAMMLFEPEISLAGNTSIVISSLSNVGPAFAEFGPTRNGAGLSPPSLVMLGTFMLFGRLEYVAALALLSRRLWRRY